jgi:glycerol uptake facilitator-like aquaporin
MSVLHLCIGMPLLYLECFICSVADLDDFLPDPTLENIRIRSFCKFLYCLGTAVAVEMLITAVLLMVNIYCLGTAVAVEMLITAVLVMVVFAAAADSNNTPTVKGSAPLAIGT